MEERGVAVRVYAPVGGYRDLLAYLVRRLLENGANTSFVHQIADRSIYRRRAARRSGRSGAGERPHRRIRRSPAPPDDAARTAQLRRSRSLGRRWSPSWARRWRRAGASRCGRRRSRRATARRGGEAATALATPVRSGRRVAGEVVEATPADVAEAVAAAPRAPNRRGTRARSRSAAAMLERLADLLERDRAALMALAGARGRQDLADALGEVREAVDFCRYYAVEARRGLRADAPARARPARLNELSLAGRGVFACVSPWNFPLAIFLGQVAAALVAGNAVVAKPAPQTPLIAAAAVRLALRGRRAPADVLALLPGRRRRSARPWSPTRAWPASPSPARPPAPGASPAPCWRTRRRPDSSPDRRDRRPQRHAGRFHRPARTGGRRRDHLGLPQRRPALLGPAPALPARGYRRPRP